MLSYYCFLNCLGFIFCRSFASLVFPVQRSSFGICCKAGLVVLSSLNFCLSGKLLISPSNLKESLAGQSILVCRFCPFITLNIACHSLLACRVSIEKSADSLIGVPLYVICRFSLVAFNILSLPLSNFCRFDCYVSRCVPPWVYPSWDSMCFLDLVDYFLSHVWEVFSYYLFKYFLRSFLSLFSLGPL